MERKTTNSVMLTGNLGRDPELKELAGGKHLVKFSVATNERFSFGDGQTKDDTQWHHVIAWGRTAQQAAEQLRKGSRLSLEGRLVHRNYEDKDGRKCYFTEVVMSDFQLVESSVEAAEAA